jgi:hypothetical protein
MQKGSAAHHKVKDDKKAVCRLLGLCIRLQGERAASAAWRNQSFKNLQMRLANNFCRVWQEGQAVEHLRQHAVPLQGRKKKGIERASLDALRSLDKKNRAFYTHELCKRPFTHVRALRRALFLSCRKARLQDRMAHEP